MEGIGDEKKKELRCVMYMYQCHTKNKNYKHKNCKKKNKKIRIMLLGTKKLVEQKWLEEDFFYCICPFIINRKQFNCPVHLQHNKKNTEGSEKT